VNVISWLAQGIIVIYIGLKSLAPISGLTRLMRLLALQKNGFTVNGIKGSSLTDDVTDDS